MRAKQPLPWKSFPWPMIGGDTGIFNVKPEEEEEEDDIILGGEDDEGGSGNNAGTNIYDNEGNINFGGNGGNNSGSNDNSGGNSGGNHFGGNGDPFDNGDDSDGDSVVFG